MSLLLTLALLTTETANPCGFIDQVADHVKTERLTGDLHQAEALTRRALECDGITAINQVNLRLELATILDRQGLHNNTRPVTEALEYLLAAKRDAAELSDNVQARVDLALARYHYRADMKTKLFSTAAKHAATAERLFESISDAGGHTDAVHLRGLFAFQKRDLATARELFDRSLELSKMTDPSLLFLADYHRHIGYVDLFSNDPEAALKHFETSYDLRRLASARDHTMFAATTWASALVDAGRPRQAEPLLQESLRLAEELVSPIGRLRSLLTSAEMCKALGDPARAIGFYRQILETAKNDEFAAYRDAAEQGLERLKPLVDGPLASAVSGPAIDFESGHWKIEAKESRIEQWNGRSCLYLENGGALLEGVDFLNGIIEVDVAMPNSRGFMGVKWRAQEDGGGEDFYLRPHQSGKPDAVQYTPMDHGISAWQLHHGSTEAVGFGATVEHFFDRWTHLRIVVSGDRADFYVDSTEPVLMASLMRPEKSGGLILHTAFAPARFANFKFLALDAPVVREVSLPTTVTKEHIVQWQLSDTFPETALQSSARLEPSFAADLDWADVRTDTNGLLNMARFHGRDQGDTAIARYRIKTAEAGSYRLAVGYSDRIRVYLDGQLQYVGDNGYRSRDFRYLGTIGLFDQVVLELDPGEHELSLAVSESFGGWGLMATLEPFAP